MLVASEPTAAVDPDDKRQLLCGTISGCVEVQIQQTIVGRGEDDVALDGDVFRRRLEIELGHLRGDEHFDGLVAKPHRNRRSHPNQKQQFQQSAAARSLHLYPTLRAHDFP